MNFEEHVLSDDEDGARSVYATDVDGDGDTDVISALTPDDLIAWYENDGGKPPAFTERIISSAASAPVSVYATDLDGDGDTDVLSAGHDNSKVLWHENLGGSPLEFKDRTIASGALFASAVYATDLDGDGDIDALSANEGGDRVVWYENDGGSPPTFSARTVSTAFVHPVSVFATDVDGDGDTDVLSGGFTGKKVAWFENDGGSPPAFIEHIVSTAVSFVASVFATDLDDDGDTDLLSAGTNVVWHENDGGSPPAFTDRVIATLSSFQSVHATDVDGDGDIDVLVAANNQDEFFWYESDGGSPPAFTERFLASSFGAESVFGTDMDGDGDTDVLLASDDTLHPVVSLFWYENFGGEIPCADVESLTARCDLTGAMSVRVTMTNSSHDGESVTIGVDGVPHPQSIVGAVATYSEPNAASGLHIITLDEPMGCLPPIGEQCPTSPVGGSVTGMSGHRVICLNETTGQSVQISDATSWDCEAAGLVVNPGDHVRQMVAGDVN